LEEKTHDDDSDNGSDRGRETLLDETVDDEIESWDHFEPPSQETKEQEEAEKNAQASEESEGGPNSDGSDVERGLLTDSENEDGSDRTDEDGPGSEEERHENAPKNPKEQPGPFPGKRIHFDMKTENLDLNYRRHYVILRQYCDHISLYSLPSFSNRKAREHAPPKETQ